MGDVMDNGYSEWLKNNKTISKKRNRLLLRGLPIIFLICLIVLFFGYDTSIRKEDLITEFVGGICGITVLLILISYMVYKPIKYIPTCNKCGKKIKKIKRDCEVMSIKFIGTEEKTIYEKKKSIIKGKTVYPRGGYSMRNDTYEYSSESTMEIEEKIPLVKKYYLYEITYGCKKCHEKFATIQEESPTPLKERR